MKSKELNQELRLRILNLPGVTEKKVTPVVTPTFPLSEIAKAQEQIETDHTQGKIVLQVSDEPKG